MERLSASVAMRLNASPSTRLRLSGVENTLFSPGKKRVLMPEDVLRSMTSRSEDRRGLGVAGLLPGGFIWMDVAVLALRYQYDCPLGKQAIQKCAIEREEKRIGTEVKGGIVTYYYRGSYRK
jgi:hypothetical protein